MNFNKYYYILFASVFLSVATFFLVRIKTIYNLPLVNFKHKNPFRPKYRGDECKGRAPYTVAYSRENNKIELCLSDRQPAIRLTCPEGTTFDGATKSCKYISINPCLNQADGAKIPQGASEFLISRGYHVCENGQIESTVLCQPSSPVFLEGRCQNVSVCSALPDGTKFAHPDDAAAFWECASGVSVKKKCEPGHYFKTTKCVPTSDCYGMPDDTVLSDPTDVRSYVECRGGQGLKRKCNFFQIFDVTKKLCVRRDMCHDLAGGNHFMYAPEKYLKHGYRGVSCNNGDRHEPVFCKPGTEVFDERIGQCRPINYCTDLVDDRVFPVDSFRYRNCENPSAPVEVPFGFMVNTFLGKIQSLCADQMDGETFGPNPNRKNEYVECFAEDSLIKTCPDHHVFRNQKCEYSPCDFRVKSQTGRIDSTRKYACPDRAERTLVIECPPGTHVEEGSNGAWCVENPNENSIRMATDVPKYVDEFRYADEFGNVKECKENSIIAADFGAVAGVVPRVASRYFFKCVDKLCGHVNRRNWPLVPATDRWGVECVDSFVDRVVDCGPDGYLNTEKILTGEYGLDDCASRPGSVATLNGASIEFSKNDTDPAETYIVDRADVHATEYDSFPATTRNEALYEEAESLAVSLPPVTYFSDNPDYDTSLDNFRRKCTNVSQYLPVKGNIKMYYSCAKNKIISCGKGKYFVNYGCNTATVHPAYNNCHLFAVCPSDNRNKCRIFKCPRARPWFNYVKKECAGGIYHAGYFLCENFFEKNFELLSHPLTRKLPEPEVLK